MEKIEDTYKILWTAIEPTYLSLDLSSIWCDLCLGVFFAVSEIFPCMIWTLYIKSLGTQLRSLTCSGLKLSLPVLPNVLTSGS